MSEDVIQGNAAWPFWIVSNWQSRGFFHGFGDARCDILSIEGELQIRTCLAVYDIHSIKLLNQVHGSNVVEIPSHFVDCNEVPTADGWLLFTSKIKNTVIDSNAYGIKTADCVPVIVFDTLRKDSAVLHCGWRGAAQSLLESCLRRMVEEGSKVNDLEIAFGPHAKSCCYEVQDNFISSFGEYGLTVDGHIEIREGRKFIDIANILQQQAKDIGVKLIYNFSVCTICDPRFFSHRRNKSPSRQVSFVCL